MLLAALIRRTAWNVNGFALPRFGLFEQQPVVQAYLLHDAKVWPHRFLKSSL
jgi:hypothetical protein